MADDMSIDQLGLGTQGIQKPGHVQRVLGDIRYRLAYIQGQLDALERSYEAPNEPLILPDLGPGQPQGLQAQATLQTTQLPPAINQPATATVAPDTATCRPRTTLPIFPSFPGGACVFTDYSAPPAISQEIGITFYLNSRHLILPFNAIPNCTNDAMFGIPSLMQNVYAYSNPFYVTTDGIRFSQIVFGVIPVDNTKPLQFGFRIKYEEDAAVTNRYNPKKIAGQVTVPKPSFFSAALEHETEGRGEHEHEPKGRGERRTKK